MGRWKQLTKIKKVIIVILTIIVINNFMIGFDFGYNVEQKRLTNLVSDTLMISKDVIEQVKVSKDRVDVYITTLNNTISTEDRSIFEYIDAKYVVKMKDKFNNKEIYLH